MNIDFKILTPIAAFGGFILGLINLLILIYKEFFKKGKLEIEVQGFQIRSVDFASYDFQLDIRFHAKNGDVYIHEIIIHNEVEDVYAKNDLHGIGSNSFSIKECIEQGKIDIKKSPEEYIKRLYVAFQENSIPTNNMIIGKDSYKSITCANRLDLVRQSDGYDEIVENGWYLSVTYNSKKNKIKIPLTIQKVGEVLGRYRRY